MAGEAPEARRSVSQAHVIGSKSGARDLDDYTVNFLTSGQTIDVTPLLEGLADDRCSCPHWGCVSKGKITSHELLHQASRLRRRTCAE